MQKQSRKNFYEEKFKKRFPKFEISIKNICLYFLIPVPVLNKLYLEGGYRKIFKFIFKVEEYRKYGLLPDENIKMRKHIENSGNIDYFPKDLT